MMLNNQVHTPGLRPRSNYNNNLSHPVMTPLDENSMSSHRMQKNLKDKSDSIMRDGKSQGRTRRAFGDISNQENSRSSNFLRSQSNTKYFPVKPNASTNKASKSVSFRPLQSSSSKSRHSKPRLDQNENVHSMDQSIFKSPQTRKINVSNQQKSNGSKHRTNKSKSGRKTKTKCPSDKFQNPSFSLLQGTLVKPLKSKNQSITKLKHSSLKSSPKNKNVYDESMKQQQIDMKGSKLSYPKSGDIVEDIELSSGRMWHEEKGFESRSPSSFSLDGCLDHIPFMRIKEIQLQEEAKNIERRKKYDREIEADLKQHESNFAVALDMMDDLFTNDDASLIEIDKVTDDDSVVDYTWMKDQTIFDLDDLSI